jgi:hypothetical protein
VKKKITLRVLGLLIAVVSLSLVSKISYAYLQAQVIEADPAKVKVTTGAVDDLKFEVGDPISISATPSTLPEGGGNVVSSSHVKATLKAGDATDTVTYPVYMYLTLSNNTFTYTKTGTPEIILTIKDSSSNDEVTNISGLTYGTYGGVSGFDITDKTGTYGVIGSISANKNTTESTTWTYTVTYLNLNFDQSGNFGHSMKVSLKVQKEA